jgi:hypothetical protein
LEDLKGAILADIDGVTADPEMKFFVEDLVNYLVNKNDFNTLVKLEKVTSTGDKPLIEKAVNDAEKIRQRKSSPKLSPSKSEAEEKIFTEGAMFEAPLTGEEPMSRNDQLFDLTRRSPLENLTARILMNRYTKSELVRIYSNVYNDSPEGKTKEQIADGLISALEQDGFILPTTTRGLGMKKRSPKGQFVKHKNALKKLQEKSVIRGRGLQDTVGGRCADFGRYCIYLPHLELNFLSIRRKRLPHQRQAKTIRGGFEQVPITPQFTELLMDIIEDQGISKTQFLSLPLEERTLLKTILDKSKVEYDNLTTEEEDDEELMLDDTSYIENRFEIVRGQILAGNDNPQLFTELEFLLRQLKQQGKLGDDVGRVFSPLNRVMGVPAPRGLPMISV